MDLLHGGEWPDIQLLLVWFQLLFGVLQMLSVV